MRNATTAVPTAVDQAPPQRRGRARWPWIAAGAPPQGRGRARWPWIAAGALAVVAIGGGAYAMSRGDGEQGTAPAAATAVTAAQSGAEGAFAFTVTGSRCGVETVGPADLLQ